MKEIERKFLVKGEFKSFAYQVIPILPVSYTHLDVYKRQALCSFVS